MELHGIRVGVTSARKGRELAAAFERSGALVAWGPTLATVPPERDPLLAGETAEILAADPTWVVVSTASGLSAWLEAADQLGRQAEVEALLRNTRVVARGAKSLGGLRALRVTPAFVSPQETMDDVCGWLSDHVTATDVLAVQVHGGEVVGTLGRLRQQVAQVLLVAPYRWVLPEDRKPAEDLVRQTADGAIDVLACTSAPCVRNLFLVAEDIGARETLVRALRERVCVAAVGQVTARAFEEVGVGVNVMPGRPRTGDLVRAVRLWATRWQEMPDEAEANGPVELVPGAHAVRLGAHVVVLGRQEFAVLAAMVRRPGIVIRTDSLAVEAWGHRAPEDPSAIKHQVARIRRKLGRYGGCVQTVRSVGYRYAPLAAEAATAPGRAGTVTDPD
jgi:uroporphyrinogen-III synthase